MTMQDLIVAHAPPQQMAMRLVALCWRPEVECYYFGYTERGGGHYLRDWYGHAGDKLAREAAAALGVTDLDTTLCWNSGTRREEVEGLALLTQRGGWSALAFWDRSGDARPGSNTAFLVRGTLPFDQIVRVARHRWPQIWARFTFPVVEVDAQGREVANG